MKAQQYGEGNDAIIAAWIDESGTGTTLGTGKDDAQMHTTIPLPTGRYIVRDWQGREHKVEAQNGVLELTLTPLPQFILKG